VSYNSFNAKTIVYLCLKDKGSDHQIFKLELESSTPSPPVFSARESILDTVSRLTGHSLKAALKENS
jgi:hypothetical protein